MRPFFCYYGGKFRAAPKYPQPVHETIVEPFAGAAGYATRYYDRRVLLFDVDPKIVGVWRYLIRTTSKEILRLPTDIQHVDELVGQPEEAKWLIGFWFNKGCNRPGLSRSKWAREYPEGFWHERTRLFLAEQADLIKHWKIYQKSYEDIQYSGTATWFVDPPYNNKAGALYQHHNVDYKALGKWVKTRLGQVIVCENQGADWLPFTFLGHMKSLEGKNGKKKSAEVIWTQG
jgi:site-specific DNA-adenine methylase